MFDFKPLTLEDKQIFDKYLKPYIFSTCEYSFTNMFIWRKALDIQYCIISDTLIIKKMDFNGDYHFMQPVGYKADNLNELMEELSKYRSNNNMRYLFKDIETPFMEEVKNLLDESFTIEEDRDNFDYIYESSKLISLSGKKLHSKKNHYNNFIKNNSFYTSKIDESNIEACIKAACEWCKQNDCKGYLKYELKAIKELLVNSNKLDLIGMAVYVDDILSAFTIGEKIKDSMAIIHIEKAIADINGLYAFINKTFVETCFSDVPFINREQDMGKEGLRKAKLSYQPFKLEQKYAVY
jgi:uncharacterized protein